MNLLFTENRKLCSGIDLIFIMPYKFLCVLTIALFVGTQLHSQQILEQLASKLTKEYADNAKELIVLQTDKPIYRAGTGIWFRAYAISSNGTQVESKDKVIYVELVNANDSVIDRVLLNKGDLQFNGSIAIGSDLKEGFYQLRVYTKTILENHPADMFVSPVYIMNDGKNVIENQQTTNEPTFKFYPEGDNLINGVPSTVVFTATDKDGRPLDVTGSVKDNFNNEVAKFSGNGIGKIVFEPYSKDRTYKVFIKTPNSQEQVYPLPAIKTGAFQLSLQKHTKDELVFRVALGDSAYNKKAASYLLGIANGKVCYAASGSAMYMVNIPLNSLPHGIIDFYLFDQNKELKSKRTVFNENYSSIMNITTDKPEYGSRQKAKLNIDVTDNEGKPVKAALSVSVTDKTFVDERRAMHVADIYLLARNRSGLLIDPFNADPEKKDLIALTLDGNGPFLKNPEVKIPVDFYWDGLQIKGKIADKAGNALTNQIVVLMPEQENATLNDSTDSRGAYAFRDMSFHGKKSFHVMLPSVFDKQLKYEIHEEPMVYPAIKTNSGYLNYLLMAETSKSKQSYFDSSVAGVTKINLQQLAMQEESGNKKSKTAKKNDLLNARRITAEQLDKLSLSNTADAVKMLPGVMMMGGRLTIRGGMMSPMGDLSDIEPLLVVDGVQTRAGSVVDYLNSIPPSNIDYIEVYTGPEASQFGSRGGNGAIVVKTSNQIRDKKDDKERQIIVASGFYKDENFYQPPYDSYAVREASFNDNRATIYWNGEVITDSTGKARVSFYTGDLKNDYMVTVQGITEKGELVFKTYMIKKK